MTQTIEQLTARVRELEEQYELAANLANTSMDRVRELEADRDQWMSDCKTFHREMEKREQQILSLQAYAEQLRAALEIASGFIRRTNDEYGVDSDESEIEQRVQSTLALPRDTSALDAYVAKRLHDMACDKGLLRIQVEELTRQRDLAVEAITRAIDMVGHPDNITYLQQTLDAIKESEAK